MNTGQIRMNAVPSLMPSATTEIPSALLPGTEQPAAEGGFADLLATLQDALPQMRAVGAGRVVEEVDTHALAAELQGSGQPGVQPPTAAPAISTRQIAPVVVETAEADTNRDDPAVLMDQPEGREVSQQISVAALQLLQAAAMQSGRMPEVSHSGNRDGDGIQKVSPASGAIAPHQPTTAVGQQSVAPAGISVDQSQPLDDLPEPVPARQIDLPEAASANGSALLPAPVAESFQALQAAATEALLRPAEPADTRPSGRMPAPSQDNSRVPDSRQDVSAFKEPGQRPVTAEQHQPVTRMSQQAVAQPAAVETVTTMAELHQTAHQQRIQPESMPPAPEQRHWQQPDLQAAQILPLRDRPSVLQSKAALPVSSAASAPLQTYPWSHPESAPTEAGQVPASMSVERSTAALDAYMQVPARMAVSRPLPSAAVDIPPQAVAAEPAVTVPPTGRTPEVDLLNNHAVDTVQNVPSKAIPAEQPPTGPAAPVNSNTQLVHDELPLRAETEHQGVIPQAVRSPVSLAGLSQQQPQQSHPSAAQFFSPSAESEASETRSFRQPERETTAGQPVLPIQTASPVTAVGAVKPDEPSVVAQQFPSLSLAAMPPTALEPNQSGRKLAADSMQNAAPSAVQNQQTISVSNPAVAKSAPLPEQPLQASREPVVVPVVQAVSEQRVLPVMAENSVAIMLSQQRPLTAAAVTVGGFQSVSQQSAAAQKQAGQPVLPAEAAAIAELVATLSPTVQTGKSVEPVGTSLDTTIPAATPQQKGINLTAAGAVAVKNHEVAMAAPVTTADAREHTPALTAAVYPVMHAAAVVQNQIPPRVQAQSDTQPADVKNVATAAQLVASAVELTTNADDTAGQHTDGGPAGQSADERSMLQQIPGQPNHVVQTKTVVSPPESPAVNPEPVVQQIRERLSQHELKPGAQQITLTLTPETLGEIRMNLNLQGQRLSVEIVTDNRSVRDAIMQHADTLKETLARQNITMESFDVTSGGKGSDGQGQNQQAWRELARQQQMQQFWTSPRGYHPVQAGLPSVTAALRQRVGQSMLDIHY